MHTIHYDWHGKSSDGSLTPKQKRENYQQNVRVNHMPSVGGHADYWGEATDVHSVFEAAKEFVFWECFEYSQPENNHPDYDSGHGWPLVNIRLTGKNILSLCRNYIKERVSK